uniref:Putative ovule protein n=1 Tax=Solanum chacoense TaxID=4108 RepID=A0A0V0HEV2_SOLCH
MIFKVNTHKFSDKRLKFSHPICKHIMFCHPCIAHGYTSRERGIWIYEVSDKQKGKRKLFGCSLSFFSWTWKKKHRGCEKKRVF